MRLWLSARIWVFWKLEWNSEGRALRDIYPASPNGPIHPVSRTVRPATLVFAWLIGWGTKMRLCDQENQGAGDGDQP